MNTKQGAIKWILFPGIVFITCLIFLLVSNYARSPNVSSPPPPSERVVYATPFGMGPDKWASAWLLKRHADPTGMLKVVPQEEELPAGSIGFDSEGAKFSRTQHSSTFSSIVANYKLSDHVIEKLVEIIHDIEINLWRPNTQPESGFIEVGFRTMQRRYPEGDVPVECYLAFFDNVHDMLASSHRFETPDSLIPGETCRSRLLTDAINQDRLVPEVSKEQVLQLIAKGNKVLFIDVREWFEFEENHVPGAVNLSIRDIANLDQHPLPEADLIITYCVKDFRGFEMARLLRQRGYENTAIMHPYGLRGWLDAGLPVYKKGEVSEQEALEKLDRCAKNNCEQSL